MIKLLLLTLIQIGSHSVAEERMGDDGYDGNSLSDFPALKLVLGFYLLAAVFLGIKFLVEKWASKSQKEKPPL